MTGAVSPRDLAVEIAGEVESYKKQHDIKGSSIPVTVSGKGQLSVGPTEVTNICNGFLDGSLSRWDVQYICDAIQLLEGVTFTSSAVEDAVAALTDPEINGAINHAAVRKLKDDLARGCL